MFIRVWDYQVPAETVEAFVAAYGVAGPWVELFGRSHGYLGTELYREGPARTRFLTIDRWVGEDHWVWFLDEHRRAYGSLDRQLEGLVVSQRALFEGTS
jgi:hypothetical protein